MKKFVFFLLMIVPFLGHASHIVGGEFELIHFSGSTYRLNLILYFDLHNGSPGAKDPDADVRIFRKSDNFIMGGVNLPLISETSVLYTSIACTIAELQTSKLLYSALIELSPDDFNDPQGYYVAWERCCRNYGISNIYSEVTLFPDGTPNPLAKYAGQTFYLEFPAVVKNGEPFIDSTPKLFPPLSDYACVNKPYYVDFAGSDDDGDSLVYSLVTPLNTKTADALPPGGFPRPRPYPNVTWQPGFSLNSVMKGNPDLAISTEGLLTVTPTIAGLFAFAVKCEEFRDGIKIGETRRDFQMLAVACPSTEYPVITGTKPGDPNTVYKDVMDITFQSNTPDNERCVSVDISDPDALNGDVNISIRAKGINGSGGEVTLPAIKTSTINNGNKTATFKICFDKCPPAYNTPYQIQIIAADDACAVPLLDTLKINVTVKTPPNGKVKFSAPVPDVVAVLKQGAPKVTWPIRAVDPDGENIVFSHLVDGFDMANVGMKLEYNQAPKGTINGQLTWDPACTYNFSTKKNFNITLVADDEDLCGHNKAVMASFNLTVIPPQTPVVTLTQPTCTTATGTIVVTILDPGDTYSFDNGASFQNSNIKSGLAPGMYQVVIKSSGCNSMAKSAVINSQPPIPTTPVILSVAQPNCTLPTGSITVAKQNNTDTYSFDNGNIFQTANSITGLAAGTYQIIIRNKEGCSSIGTSVIINAQPTAPPSPVVTVTQPTCAGTTGTIVVTIQKAEDLYSFDNGLSFQTSNILSGLVAGTYAVVIKNGVGCSSIATAAVVNPPFPVPVPAVISGSPIVCAMSPSVDYIASNVQYTYAWFITGGTLKSKQNNKIKVDWGADNSAAWVKAIATDKQNCLTDTMKFSVKILNVKPTIPLGIDSVCYNFRAGVPYQTSNTAGSVYTWFTDGGVVSEGQTNSLAKVDWANVGQYNLWVKEESPAGTDYCEGISDTLKVTVFKDLAAITMSFASVDYENESRVQLQWDATMLERISDLVTVSRRALDSNALWEVVATVNKNVKSFLDQNVLTDQYAYEYKVEGFNKCDEALQTAVHNTIKLAGEKDEEEELIDLTWNDYNGWPEVEQYEIWRKLDGAADYELLHVNDGNSTNYVGKHGSDGFTHVLRVKAKKKNENIISWSNEIELTFDNPIEIPNVITPNGDDKNEYFVILRLHLYPDSELSIYNSWGEVVYQSRNYKNDWRAGGLASGVYYYSLNLKQDNKIRKGWVQVVR